jgi:hypothetical protein
MREVRTHYSEPVDGDEGNYKWAVRFDKTRGYIGITQYEDGKFKERVLLTRKQFRALVKFVGVR